MRRKLIEYLSPQARLKRFRKADDGSVLIEFGFIAPVFFLLVFVLIETALMMFQEYAMQAGIQEAARMIRTGQAQNAGWTVGSFKTKACEFAKIIPNCSSKIKVYINSNTTFVTMKAAAPDFTTVGTGADGSDQNTTFTCGEPQQVVTVIATYDHQFIMPVMQFFKNTSSTSYRRLSAGVMFRNEPFQKTGSCA
jgi:Flp pilus assembly protein TadG